MQDAILGVVIPAAVVVVVGIVVRLTPRGKVAKWVKPPCFAAGKALSKILTLKIGKRATVKLEEGVVATLVYAIEQASQSFLDGMLFDNLGRKGKDEC